MSNIIIEKQGRVTIFTLNRPERMNAMSKALIAELAAGVKAFNADPEQYVAIITATGDRAFSAGGDLKDMDSAPMDGPRPLPMIYETDIAGVAASEKPVIAAINGLAVAGGLELALCCDIRIAAENAWFGVFEVARGLIAGVAVSMLPRLLPMGVAKDMMLAGERLSAADAYRFGLVQKVVPQSELLGEAVRKAEAIAGHAQTAVWGTKKIMNFWRDAMLVEQHRYYEAVAHRVFLSGDLAEGVKAFVEKRPPEFSNRWRDPFSIS